jgi:hypothetical protein
MSVELQIGILNWIVRRIIPVGRVVATISSSNMSHEYEEK